MLFLFIACTPPSEDTSSFGSWELFWTDEFDGAENTEPDPTKWLHDVGGDGWGNNQLEYNTSTTNNVRLTGDGFLEIRANRENLGDNEYTSGRIKTKERFEHSYGRYEARIKLPEGQGLWPAFWMLGANIDEAGWPACGEIDILEMRGDNPQTVMGTIHGPGYSGGSGLGGEFSRESSFADDFHVFRVDVDDQHLSWFVDDEHYLTITPGDLPVGTAWVYDHDFFLLLNLAVGGNFLEDPTEETAFPASMLIDYVHVYRRVE